MPIAGVAPRATETGDYPPGTVLDPRIPVVQLGPIPFNQVDDDGVAWYLVGLDGWWDEPDTTAASTQRPDDHGSWVGPAWMPERTITITGRVAVPDPSMLEAALDRIGAAVPFLPTQTLTVLSDSPRYCTVGRSGQIKKDRVGWYAADVQIPLTAPDPRRYAADIGVLTTTLPAPSGGLAPPLTPPLLLPSRPGGGFITGTNGGNLDAPWLARIDGPIAQPRLSYVTADRYIAFNLELAAGDWLTVDARERTAVLNGQVSRTSAIVPGSSWWLLAAGQPYEVAFLGAPTTSDAPRLAFSPLICWS